MKSSDSLFALIASLTSSEKRYFKLFISLQRGEKNYQRLFEAIDAQQEYDEEAIREIFRGEQFLNQLHVAKNYLARLIMRSLRAYRAESSIDARLDSLLFDARILFEKGLREHCRRALKKARELAERHERDLYLLRIIDLERPLLAFERPPTEESIAAGRQQRREILERLDEHYELESLGQRSSMVVLGNGKPRDVARREYLQDILRHPLLRNGDALRSRQAKGWFHYIHSSFHFAGANPAAAHHHTMQRLKLLESSPESIVDNAEEYVGALTNLLVLHERVEPDGDFHDLLARMRSVPELLRKHRVDNPRIHYRVFNFSYGIEISAYVQQGEFERVEKMIPTIESGLREFERYITPVDRLRFHFLLSTTHLALGRFRLALDEINLALATPEPPARLALHCTAKLVDLIIHCELGNMELLEYRAQSTQRFLGQRGALHRFEEVMLGFFRKLPAMRNGSEVSEAFGRLRDELIVLSEQPLERSAFDYFNYLAWVESRIQGIGYAEAVRRRAAESAEAA